MSTIYFRTEHEGVAEVRGSERAYAGSLTRNIAASVIWEPFSGCIDPVARYFPSDWQTSMPSYWPYERKMTSFVLPVYPFIVPSLPKMDRRHHRLARRLRLRTTSGRCLREAP
jgi:hypothetical protein